MEVIVGFFAWLAAFLTGTVIPVAIIVVVGILLIRFVMGLLDKALTKANTEKAAKGLLMTVAKVALYGLLCLIIASRLGIDVTGIVALASVLTLAVSLAIQNLLSNLVSGFVLLYTKPFVAGDLVEIAGQTGTVLEIGMTYTKLQTPDNKEVYIPNSSVTAAEIINYTVRGSRRIDITVSAAYTEAIDSVLEALREAGNVPTALKDPAPFAAVQKYGDSAIEYVLQVWTGNDDYWTTVFDTNANIKAVFDAKGIKMTFPHLNVHLDK